MPFIRTIPHERAGGTLKALYDRDIAAQGRVSTVTEAWSLRPAVLVAWQSLITAISPNMDARRYLLVTLVASARARCSI